MSSQANQPQLGDDANNNLPPGLMSGLGSVDLSFAAFSAQAIKAGTAALFDFTDLSDGTQESLEYHDPSHANPSVSKNFTVPSWLNFSKSSSAESFGIEGSSKSDFKQKLSGCVELKVEGFLDTYDGEFQRSFNTTTEEEDFRKYVNFYERHTVYRVNFVDDVAAHVRAQVKVDFLKMSAQQIVDRYGTHYMTAAYFGGVRVFSATLDARDSFSENELSQALQLKMTGENGTATGSSKTSSDRVQKISTSLAQYKCTVIGGEAIGNQAQAMPASDAWIESLYFSPTVIGYTLAPLADLVRQVTNNDAIAQAVSNECTRRLGKKPMKTYPLLAMRVPIEPFATDGGSGASQNLAVGRPTIKYSGWFYIGQYGLQTPSGQAFPEGAHGLIFKAWPGAESCDPPVLICNNGFERRWGKSSSYGLFRPKRFGDDRYVSIGDTYQSTDDAGNVRDDSLALVRSDLFEDVPATNSIWSDAGSGAQDDGSIWGIPTPEDETIQAWGSGQTPRLFAAQNNYDNPGAVHRLRPDCYKVINSTYLFA